MDPWTPKRSYHAFTSILTTIVAYSYQTSVFPVYNALSSPTPAVFAKVQTLGLATTLVVYLVVAGLGLMCFGTSIKPSVLLNYGDLTDLFGQPLFVTYVIQVSFIVVLICHIPFIFYAGKEGALMITTEKLHRTVSNAFIA